MTLSLTSLIQLLRAQNTRIKSNCLVSLNIIDETTTENTINIKITLPKNKCGTTKLCRNSMTYKNGRRQLI